MKSEKERWDKAAREYAEKVESKESQGFLIRDKCLNPYLFDALGDVRNRRILDYGCGDGWLCSNLKNKGAIMEGCDISPEFIRMARANYHDIKFEVIDKKVPCRDNEFDIVISNIVLHITRDYKNVINEMYRVLKPGGKCIVTIMHPLFYKEDIINPKKKRESLKIKVEETVPVIYYKREMDIYEKEFKNYGFKIIKRQPCIAKEKLEDNLKKYSEKPFFILYELKKEMTYAAAAIIKNSENLVLLAKRAPTKQPFPNHWSLPSTSYQKEENPEEKLKDALKKKLGIGIIIKGIFGTKEGRQEDHWLKMTDYEAEIVNGIIRPDKTDYTRAEYLNPKEIVKNPEKTGFCMQILLEKMQENKSQ